MPRHRAKKKLVFGDERRDFVEATAKKRRKTAIVQAEFVKPELPGLEKQLEIIDEVIGWGFTNPEQETQRAALDAEHNIC